MRTSGKMKTQGNTSWKAIACVSLGGVVSCSAGCVSTRAVLHEQRIVASASSSQVDESAEDPSNIPAEQSIAANSNAAVERPTLPDVTRLVSYSAQAASPSDRPVPSAAANANLPADQAPAQLAPPLPDMTAAAGAVNPQGMSLEEFELLAFAHNPTIQALAATTQKAAGFRTQVSLRANPTVGYQGVQLADQGTDQHTAFVEQEFVTAGKLGLNRRVLNEALRAQVFELEAQKQRVATDVRIKFYEALAAQQRIELVSEFQNVANHGLELAELRKQALVGSQVDVLQAKIQKNEVDLAHTQASVAYRAAWQELAALTGCPDLQPVPLTGKLPDTVDPLDWVGVAGQLVSGSPEFQAAQIRVRQAVANLQRQGVQAVPNLTLQVASGYDNGTGSELINVQFGAPLPLFNKNQGNIAAAQAEYCRAVMEVERIKNSIQARLASVSREYDSALAAVDTYANQILPSAQDTLELAEVAYKSGETSFVQVLVARRTYFESNLQYLLAQSQLAQARAKVDGYVLTGGLDSIIDESGDDSLRGLTFGQQ